MTTPDESLPTGSWHLIRSAHEGVDLAGFGITLEVRGTAVGGRAGVNRFHGSATRTGPTGDDGVTPLRLGPLATTLMAGPPPAMAAERAYLGLLAAVSGFRLVDGQLELLDGHAPVLLYAPGGVPRTV